MSTQLSINSGCYNTMVIYRAIKQLIFQLVLHVKLLNTGVVAVNSNACEGLRLNKMSVKSNITDCRQTSLNPKSCSNDAEKGNYHTNQSINDFRGWCAYMHARSPRFISQFVTKDDSYLVLQYSNDVHRHLNQLISQTDSGIYPTCS